MHTYKLPPVNRYDTKTFLNSFQRIGWQLKYHEITNLWNQATGKGVNVYIVDTGASDHEDLEYTKVYNAISDKEEYFDYIGHGTHVAAIAGAKDNEEGMVGVAPDCNLISVNVFRDDAAYSNDIVKGLEWVLNDKTNNRKVVNMSFGSPNISHKEIDILEKMHNAGIVLVAAVGNSDYQFSDVFFPCKTALCHCGSFP